VNLKKGLSRPGTLPAKARANNAVAERHDSSADSRKAGFLPEEQASAPTSLDLCGRLSVGDFDVKCMRIDAVAGPDQETSL
jgi:hypothetical protein